MSEKPIDDLNIAEVEALPDEGPVVMVNLVRLRERSLDGKGTGWDAYKRYSALLIKMIKARGGTVLWAGHRDTVALGRVYGHQWHYVVLIRYPSRAAFLDLMTAPDYEAANAHRMNGCAEHVIIATREAYSKFPPA